LQSPCRSAPRTAIRSAISTILSALVDQVNALARDKRSTPSHLALARLLAQGKGIVPIPGTSSVARLEDGAGAINVHPSSSDHPDSCRAKPEWWQSARSW
jgi:aryl-alcohol dehydrogenase-like predicted oxidoreductase